MQMGERDGGSRNTNHGLPFHGVMATRATQSLKHAITLMT